jgi:biopolymer transport protein ExbD
MKFPTFEIEDPDINVSSLIDMVFLLLSYFIVSASLVRSEADLGIRLPGMLAQAQTVDMADEQIIEIRDTGRVVLNGLEYDSPDSTELPQLVQVLTRYRLASEAARAEPMITLQPDEKARHQRVVDVMNACARAGIKNVTFAAGGG